MFRAGAAGLIALGAIHLLVLGVDAARFVPDWLSGELWTMEHWRPVTAQSPALVHSGFAFWSTVASAAAPMILLGALFLWLDRRGLPVPRRAAAAVLAWALVLSALMPPSGFVAVAAAGAALVGGRPRGGWA